MSNEREIMTWEIFGEASRKLAQMVADDGYEPDMILSIARGGLLIVITFAGLYLDITQPFG